MTDVHHLRCGTIEAPGGAKAICHCLLLEDDRGLALVDAGIGLEDVRSPDARLGRGLVEAVGFRFDEAETAVRRVERLGLAPAAVAHVVLTHADPDHTGGLADFPDASVFLSVEERAALDSGNPRYVPTHFDHGPRWEPILPSSRRWFGLEARPVPLGFASEVLLIPLFGHTRGHCGVAIGREGEGWTLHVGDAYYLRVETERDDHPVSRLAAMRADDDARRRASLEEVRRLLRDHRDEISLFGYHDPDEFPPQA
ncbi:MBL fold metallo-hydrolase [Tautonia plasticadhaerens]|uniref:Metallo-beta-lactamase superfamily protein n=1 Tax=Tautonia plasticadhaerens TaxID=2527974 RepID=A0A518H5D2_9BACT|nr:MBL fold metallo-hydrolase [Tautonia plasticadhaerens]QDV36051.1 Metallo-beta-lactamase superfamily protein [Tautonia plasticadhaerens]